MTNGERIARAYGRRLERTRRAYRNGLVTVGWLAALFATCTALALLWRALFGSTD